MTGVADGTIKLTGYDSLGNPREVLLNIASGAAIVSELSPVFDVDRYVEYAQNATTPLDNVVVWTSPDLTGYSVHTFHCTAGSISVEGDIHGDGTQWTGDLTGRDLLSTATGTFVATIPTGGIFEIVGRYRNLRVKSNNAVATTVVCRSIHSNGAVHG